MLINMIFIIILFCVIFMLVNMLISKKDWLDRDKNSSFECGFDPLNSSRLPFSIHFYLIGILFLIFDVEVIFLFPMINLYKYLNLYEWLFLGFMILMILYLGLEFEKLEGSLKWIF